jgi:hypothetical protein
MIVYCTGCSHTEGVGLADNVFFIDEYPGEVHSSRLDNVSWTNRRSELLAKNTFLFETLRQENLKRSWPSHLSAFIGNKVINGGVGGASIQSLSMSLMYDINEMIKEDETPGAVVVCLPTIHRIPLLNKNPIKGYNTLAFKNVLPCFLQNVFKGYERYCQGYFESHSDEEILTFYLYHCVAIKNFVKATVGVNPIFLKSYEFKEWEYIVESSNIYLLKSYWENLNFTDLMKQKALSSFVNESQLLLPDGHFPEYVHKDFASYINSKFFNN